MGSPTDEYLQKDRLVRSALKNANLGGLETKFEHRTDDYDEDDFVDVDENDFAGTNTNEYMNENIEACVGGLYYRKIGEVQILSTFPPDRVGFYERDKKVGELYFTEEPMRLVGLESSFKQYADELRKKLGI